MAVMVKDLEARVAALERIVAAHDDKMRKSLGWGESLDYYAAERLATEADSADGERAKVALPTLLDEISADELLRVEAREEARRRGRDEATVEEVEAAARSALASIVANAKPAGAPYGEFVAKVAAGLPAARSAALAGIEAVRHAAAAACEAVTR